MCHNPRSTGVTWKFDWSVDNIDVSGRKSLIAVAVLTANDVGFKQRINRFIWTRMICDLPDKFCLTSAPVKIPDTTRLTPLWQITDLNFDLIESEQLLSGVVESFECVEFKVFVLIGSHGSRDYDGPYYLQGGNGISCQTWPSTSTHGGRTWRTRWCMRPVEIKPNQQILIAVAVPATKADEYRMWLLNNVSGRPLDGSIHDVLKLPSGGILVRLSIPERFRQSSIQFVKPPRFPPNWQAEPIKHDDGPGGCVICTEFKADASIKPCNHLCVCMKCAKDALKNEGSKCPICKAVVSHVEGQHLA